MKDAIAGVNKKAVETIVGLKENPVKLSEKVIGKLVEGYKADLKNINIDADAKEISLNSFTNLFEVS